MGPQPQPNDPENSLQMADVVLVVFIMVPFPGRWCRAPGVVLRHHRAIAPTLPPSHPLLLHPAPTIPKAPIHLNLARHQDNMIVEIHAPLPDKLGPTTSPTQESLFARARTYTTAHPSSIQRSFLMQISI